MYSLQYFIFFAVSFSSIHGIENLPEKHIKHVMLYEYFKGTNAHQCFQNMERVYGSDTPTQQTCYNWFEKFRTGDITLADEPRGRPTPAINDDLLIAEISKDHRLSSRELGEKFNVDHKTILNHLHRLGYVSRLGAWVPHSLSDSQKWQRMSICGALLSRVDSHPHSFYPYLITGDEKWVLSVNFRRKRQWVAEGETPEPDVKPEVHQKKFMLSVFWDIEGPLFWELLDPETTLNKEKYAEQLDKVNASLTNNRPKKRKIIFQMDNARPHVSKLVREKLRDLGWEILAHPAYSPDLAPSDYYLFRAMNNDLANVHFATKQEVEAWLTTWFASRPADFYSTGIRALRGRWNKVLEADGNYILD